MDQNLEMLIRIGETCLKSPYYLPETTLWCTASDGITVQSLLDLKRYRAAEELGTIAKQQLTAKGQNLPLDCIGIKTDAESGKTSAI